MENLKHFFNLVLANNLSITIASLSLSLDYQIFNNSTVQVSSYLSSFPGLSLPAEMSNASLKRIVEFLAGRLCAINAMKKHGVMSIVQPGRNADRSPIWQSNIVGSISHSNNIAIAVIGDRAQYKGVGVDIEEILPNKKAAVLLPLVVGNEEMKKNYISKLSTADTFAIIFSGKEALFKALYPLVQKRFYFHDVCCIDINFTQNSWSMVLLNTLSPTHCSGRIYHGYFYTGYGYVVSFIALDDIND